MTVREKTVPAKLEDLDALYAFVEETLEEAFCPMGVQNRISVAVDEVCANIVRYAYPDGEGDMVLRIEIGEGTAKLIFSDAGTPFDPLARETSGITSNDPPIGGLGIHMIKKLMDEVGYERKDGKNVLTLLKRWEET